MSTIQDTILDRIRGQGRGKVFTPKDFLDLGSRDAADQSLSRLVRGGEVQRLGRGLYHYPRINERLGIPLGPDFDEIAEALARQTGSRVVPSGAVAANRLGLSTQVPAKPVYLTDGRTRRCGSAARCSRFGTRPRKNSRLEAAQARWCSRHCGTSGSRRWTIRWWLSCDELYPKRSGRNF